MNDLKSNSNNRSSETSSIQPWEYVIDAEIDWFEEDIGRRLESSESHFEFSTPPDISGAPGAYAELVDELNLDKIERAILMFLFCVHANPGLIDRIAGYHGNYFKFSSGRNKNSSGLSPTADSFLKILAPNSYLARKKYTRYFESENILFRKALF